MYLISESTIGIELPSLQVFEYISNMENFAQWFPGVVSIKSVDQKGHGEVGKKYLESVTVPLRGKQNIELSVVESIPGKLFCTIGEFKPLLPKMKIELLDLKDGGCELSWRMYSRNDSKLVHFLVLPLAKRIMQNRAGLGVVRLKRKLENKTDQSS